MEKTNNINSDLNTLLKNFQDIKIISQKVLKDIDNKNTILTGGMHDCYKCTKAIDSCNCASYFKE